MISKVDAICEIAHETIRAFQEANGEQAAPAWDDVPAWMVDSTKDSVLKYMLDPKASPEEAHEVWMHQKREAGWVHGPMKDENKKTHPSMIPYDQLPLNEKVKDHLFLAVVRAGDKAL